MESLYVACDFGMDRGRIALGALDKGRLRLSDIRRFSNAPIRDKHGARWDIPQLYRHLIEGLSEVASTCEAVNGVSSSSWGQDYVLFDADQALITPVAIQDRDKSQASMEHLLSRIPDEEIYEETGVQPDPRNTVFQMAADKGRRLSGADVLLPVADGFNYLLSGEARVESSIAGPTQLFNPLNNTWSNRLLTESKLPARLLPTVVPSGTVLGSLRDDVLRETRLEAADVVSGCSCEMAAMLAGLPANDGVNWAYLKPGTWASMGMELPCPVINDEARRRGFSNGNGCGGTYWISKQTAGFWIVEECQRYWAETEQNLDRDVIIHLAASSEPFQSLINPMDARFLTPGDMPAKIKEFCRETDQPIPRKPGPIIRCVLESVALYYRRVLREMEYLTGRPVERLYMFSGGTQNQVLNHFIANALQIPVVLVGEEACVVGNIMVQAMALGHVKTVEQARQIVSESFRFEVIQPHAAIWDAAFERLETLV